MALEIVWTTIADEKFDQVCTYLLEEWGEKSVKVFVSNFYDFLDILSEFPEIGSVQHAEKDIRGFVLNKQITVFYKIVGNQIRLLDLFDNRCNPDTGIIK